MQKQLCDTCKFFYAAKDSKYCSQHGGDPNLSIAARLKASKVALAAELGWGEKEFEALRAHVRKGKNLYEALHVIHVMCNNQMRQELKDVPHPIRNYRCRSNLTLRQVVDLLHDLQIIHEGRLPNTVCELIISRYYRGEEYLDAHPLDQDKRDINYLDETGGCLLVELLYDTRDKMKQMPLAQYREFLLR